MRSRGSFTAFEDEIDPDGHGDMGHLTMDTGHEHATGAEGVSAELDPFADSRGPPAVQQPVAGKHRRTTR